MTALLIVENLTVAFRRGTAAAVDNVSLTVNANETVGLVGESGSGKTTIGRAILGLAPVTSGRILFDGADIGGVAAASRGPTARRIQTIFQDPGGSLNPARTVGFSIAEPFRAAGGRRGTAAAGQRTAELLRAVGLAGDDAGRYAREFSGGQRQRIATARALAAFPDLVICDEPTSALDLSTQAQVLNLLADLRAQRGLSYLFISHDLAVVRHMADRIVVLYRGRVMESGPAELVSTRPLHPYSQALRAAAPVADVAEQRRRRAERHRLRAAASGPRAPTAQTQTPQTPTAHTAQSCPFVTRCPAAAPVCGSARPIEISKGPLLVACHRYDPRSGHPDRQDLPDQQDRSENAAPEGTAHAGTLRVPARVPVGRGHLRASGRGQQHQQRPLGAGEHAAQPGPRALR